MKPTLDPPMVVRPSHRPLVLAALGLALLSVSGLRAAPIPINNFSFESATYSGANSWTNDLNDTDPNTTIEWVGRDGSNSGQCFIERIGGFFSGGLAHIGMERTYFIYQDTGQAWKANTKYTLTVGVGNRNAGFTPGTNLSVIGLTDVVPAAATMADLLANDPFLAGANATLNAFDQGPSVFKDLVVTFDTGAVAPAGTVVVVMGDNSGGGRSHFDNVRLDATTLLDPDADGLPSDWELDNGLNPNLGGATPDGASGDPDNDTSTNLQEFQRGTKPKDNDTDDDGALDGHESDTGTLVSLTNLGTDPLVPDSDGDTLLDGNEAGAAQPTDPNKADTDGDEFEDKAELTAGTNPSVNGAGSKPTATGDLLLGLNFVGGRVNGTPGANVTGTAGVVPQSNWNNLIDSHGTGVALKNGLGTDVIMRATWTVDDTFTIEDGVPPDAPVIADQNSALMQGSLYTRKGVSTSATVRNIPYAKYDVYVYADGPGTDRTANYTVNGVTITGVMDSENWPVETGGGLFQEVVGDNAPGNYMVFRNVTGPTMTLSVENTTSNNDFGASINAVQIVVAAGDTDGDGMPDIWEDANGTNKNLNDAALNPDDDGLTNVQEFERGTKPMVADTDGDTLKDGVETKTGTYVGPSNTGTDPLRPDSDNDGLTDGVENNSGTFVNASNPGTNPTKADTDADGFTDNQEVVAGTNPVNAASKPAIPTPIGYWPFDDQNSTATDDASPGGNDGNVTGGATYVAGHTGTAGDFAIQFDGVDGAVSTGVALLDARDAFTMAGFIKFSAAQAARTGLFGQNDCVEFGLISATSIELWTPTGGALQTPADPVDDDVWHHIAVVGDAGGRQIYIDGALSASGSVGTPTASTNGSFNIGGNGVYDGAGNFFNGIIDDVAVWDTALGDTFIAQLASGAITPLGTPATPATPFLITSFSYTPGTSLLNLTFQSVAGSNYALEYSTGFLPAGAPTSAQKWNVVPGYSSIPASAGTTTAITPLNTTTLVTPTGQLPDNSQSYFRVRKL